MYDETSRAGALRYIENGRVVKSCQNEQGLNTHVEKIVLCPKCKGTGHPIPVAAEVTTAIGTVLNGFFKSGNTHETADSKEETCDMCCGKGALLITPREI